MVSLFLLGVGMCSEPAIGFVVVADYNDYGG
jgi:hypothetical protein